MKDSNNLKFKHKCQDCDLRNTDSFCNFSSASTQRAFESIKISNTYPKGFRLFTEGQPSEGVHILCRGRVKLLTHSQNGKALILHIGEPGEVLGLYAAVSNAPHETTAEVIESCQINFIRKDDFSRFLNANADAGMNALRQISLQYKKAYMQIRSLGLSTCVADKLAAILLEWSKDAHATNGSVHLRNTFSHEEMAEMIGTSRETVTRLLKSFRERGLISVKGSDLLIRDTHRLEETIGNGNWSKPYE